jgi:hypothetical protein
MSRLCRSAAGGLRRHGQPRPGGDPGGIDAGGHGPAAADPRSVDRDQRVGRGHAPAAGRPGGGSDPAGSGGRHASSGSRQAGRGGTPTAGLDDQAIGTRRRALPTAPPLARVRFELERFASSSSILSRRCGWIPGSALRAESRRGAGRLGQRVWRELQRDHLSGLLQRKRKPVPKARQQRPDAVVERHCPRPIVCGCRWQSIWDAQFIPTIGPLLHTIFKKLTLVSLWSMPRPLNFQIQVIFPPVLSPTPPPPRLPLLPYPAPCLSSVPPPPSA